MVQAPSPPPDFLSALSRVVGQNVSRETFLTLQAYVSLVAEASQVHNLMGAQELPRVWGRHILDSAQLFPFLTTAGGVADLGTGAGLPGVVLALLGVRPMHLVESTLKKCRFLEHVSRETSVPLEVHAQRCEDISSLPVTHVVSRAMAPVSQVLVWARPWLQPHQSLIFLKGRRAYEELLAAKKIARFSVETHPSQTDPSGRVLILTRIRFL